MYLIHKYTVSNIKEHTLKYLTNISNIVGRLRDRGYETVYVDICDKVKYAKTISNWGSRRRQMFKYFPGVFREQRKFSNIYC